MVVAIAALAATGLVVTDVSGMVLLRSYLVRRIDDQLRIASQGGPRGGPGAAPGVVRSMCADAIYEQAQGQSQNAGFPWLRVGPDSRFVCYTATGTIAFSGGTSNPDLGTFASLKAHVGDQPYTVADWRVRVEPLDVDGYYRVTAASLRDVLAIENQLLAIDLAVTGLVLVLIAFAAASVVRLGLRPLTRMENIAAEIAGGVGADQNQMMATRVADAEPHTESGRLGLALNVMLGQIEVAMADRTASEQRLRQFLADASHELRTPLTSIQGFAELYRRGGAPPGPALDEAMGRIEGEVGRMRLLVNDLLLLARMDEERRLDLRPVDLLEVAADAVRDAHVRVPTRFVLLDGFGSAGFEPVTVLADDARIRQVATNLVANALQHTPDDAQIVVRVGRPDDRPEPPPTATIGAEPEEGVPIAALEVADSGPGMREDDARRAFERLYRVDASRSRSHGGTGLGLSIVAAIVNAHRGRIELWSGPGRGARFRVLLPAVGPEPGALELGGPELTTVDIDAEPGYELRAGSELT
jgi:two-component system OmpR family sensor kinase